MPHQPPLDRHLIESVLHVYDLLVCREYRELEKLSKGRVTAEDIARTVREYPCHLEHWPRHLRAPVEAIPVDDSNMRKWIVDFFAYTRDEGPSDLCLRMTLTKNNGCYDVEFDDLLVP